MNLMENEINANFHNVRITTSEIKCLLENSSSENPRYKYFKRELQAVIDEFEKLNNNQVY